MTEAVSLESEVDAFVDETGIELSPLVVLFQDAYSETPDGEDAIGYHEDIEEPSFPVTADLEGRVFGTTPYDGSALPGKCVLTPQMEILTCMTGHGLEDLFDAIEEDAEAR